MFLYIHSRTIYKINTHDPSAVYIWIVSGACGRIAMSLYVCFGGMQKFNTHDTFIVYVWICSGARGRIELTLKDSFELPCFGKPELGEVFIRGRTRRYSRAEI